MGHLTCYVIPGLGATGELFSQVELPPWMDVHAIAWEPCQAGESIAEYSARLLEQVDQSRPHIYVGCSFGAAIAVELALVTRPLLTVIVSGVAQKSEIPFYLRRARALGFYNLAPLIVRLWTPLLRWGAAISFGTRDPAGIDMLVRMIRSIDPTFYECGLKALMSWPNETVPKPLLHIHGARDLLLPARYVQPDLLIPKAGHFIIYSHGHQIGEIIAHAARLELEKSRQPAERS
jgi:pimeloyl-ACP methyl ester carboxylesterase